MLSLAPVRTLDLTEPARADGPRWISAASGLVRQGERLFVVADDGLHLAVFDPGRPGRLLRLVEGSLPADAAERKRRKPDFEVLTRLPTSAVHPNGALLALGSGSTAGRRRAVIVLLDAAGEPLDAGVIDLSALYRLLAETLEEPNIEGGIFDEGDLVLFQRGNRTRPDNAMLRLRQKRPGDPASPDLVSMTRVEIGMIGDVPLCFTDACPLGDGRIAFSAVAEDTPDSYRDGACVGAAVGVIDRAGRVLRVEMLDAPHKIEGIDAWPSVAGVEFLAVTDADDADTPAVLLKGTLAAA